MTLLLLVLLAALVFEYINGFHDTANAIATVVSTKVLTPRMAVLWAAFWNLIGALTGTAVAKTISSGLVEASAVNTTTIFAALCGGIIWNIFTWWLGLPSSSSHALIGGLCGAALATAKGNWGVLMWSRVDAKGAAIGLWPKVVKPMVGSPVLGFIGGALLMILLIMALRKVTPHIVNLIFGKAQLLSAGFMGWSHGTNDAQKTMGIITLALVANGSIAADAAVPTWVIWTCALAMALGTFIGGWRIIRTMGHGLTHIDPTQGFAAQMSSSVVLLTSSHLGLPLSTTYVATGSVVGTGVATRGRKVHWNVAGRVVAAWLITLPAAGLVGAAMFGVESLFSGSLGEIVVAILLVGYAGTIFVRSRRQVVDHTNVNEPWKSELDEPVATAVAA